ncbi:helix-turn-helix transcriptional regulator [Actinocorallia aurantiaca]
MPTTSAPQSVDPKAGMWAWLAYELRFQRTSRGKSLADAACHIPTSRKTVQNWEAARHKPSEEACRRLDDAWETGGLLERIYFYATTAHNPDWFVEYLRYEAHASVIRIHEVSWIPGLLQTEEYARAVLTAGRSTQVDEQVAARLRRQQILTSDDPPHVSVLIDENALLRLKARPFAQGQLSKLLDATDHPNTIIRIVPLSSGLHVGLNGPFEILTTASGDIAYTDAAIGGRLVTEASGVRTCAIAFDHIGADALPRAATKTLLHTLLESP